MNQMESTIIETVDVLKDDLFDFTCRLVREPSTVGNELSVLQVMEQELKKLDFKPVKVPIDPHLLEKHPGFARVPWGYENRYNLVAKRESSAEGGRGEPAISRGGKHSCRKRARPY